MTTKKFGDDLTKWYIRRDTYGIWRICPPVTDDELWYTKGGNFPTGAEAISTFAAGGKQ